MTLFHAVSSQLFSRFLWYLPILRSTEYIQQRKQYVGQPQVAFHKADYTKDFGEQEESFDLLISQYAGFISQAGKKYLKIGGILVANNSHGDASMAMLDPDYEFIGVYNRRSDTKYTISAENLDTYFIPKKSDLIITKEYLEKTQRGVGYTKTPSGYLFKRISPYSLGDIGDTTTGEDKSTNYFDDEKNILGNVEVVKANGGGDSIAIMSELEFQTERLLVRSWQHYASTINDENAFAERIISILTPEVTKALPEGWQEIDTIEKANEWIKARNEDSEVFTIQYAPEGLVVGFLFLNGEYSSDPNLIDLRLGYLLSEEVWGKGLGSELIKGLVEWCEKAGNISSISGGVEISNKASIRVLEKNGFSILSSEEPHKGMIFLERKFKPIN